jgi:uncharacterized RDD family membrane protein YckC
MARIEYTNLPTSIGTPSSCYGQHFRFSPAVPQPVHRPRFVFQIIRGILCVPIAALVNWLFFVPLVIFGICSILVHWLPLLINLDVAPNRFANIDWRLPLVISFAPLVLAFYFSKYGKDF